MAKWSAVAKVAELLSGLFRGRKKESEAHNQLNQLNQEFHQAQQHAQHQSQQIHQLTSTLEKFQQDTQLARDEAQRLQQTLDQQQQQSQQKYEKLLAKIRFVNALRIVIFQTTALALIGLKGQGKSTFTWLCGLGPKPTSSLSDGTTHMTMSQPTTDSDTGNGSFQRTTTSSTTSFPPSPSTSAPGSTRLLDTIGLANWTIVDVYKAIVLMLYNGGIARDLIVFQNVDRITAPLAVLGYCGIQHVMVSILASNFWQLLEPSFNARGDGYFARQRQRSNSPAQPAFQLQQDSATGIRYIHPTSAIGMVYNETTYDIVQRLAMATPVTHEDIYSHFVQERRDPSTAVNPFASLLNALGTHVLMPEPPLPQSVGPCSISTSPTGVDASSIAVDCIGKLVYIYEVGYRGRDGGDLLFMNTATLAEFDTLELPTTSTTGPSS